MGLTAVVRSWRKQKKETAAFARDQTTELRSGREPGTVSMYEGRQDSAILICHSIVSMFVVSHSITCCSCYNSLVALRSRCEPAVACDAASLLQLDRIGNLDAFFFCYTNDMHQVQLIVVLSLQA